MTDEELFEQAHRQAANLLDESRLWLRTNPVDFRRYEKLVKVLLLNLVEQSDFTDEEKERLQDNPLYRPSQQEQHMVGMKDFWSRIVGDPEAMAAFVDLQKRAMDNMEGRSG